MQNANSQQPPTTEPHPAAPLPLPAAIRNEGGYSGRGQPARRWLAAAPAPAATVMLRGAGPGRRGAGAPGQVRCRARRARRAAPQLTGEGGAAGSRRASGSRRRGQPETRRADNRRSSQGRGGRWRSSQARQRRRRAPRPPLPPTCCTVMPGRPPMFMPLSISMVSLSTWGRSSRGGKEGAGARSATPYITPRAAARGSAPPAVACPLRPAGAPANIARIPRQPAANPTAGRLAAPSSRRRRRRLTQRAASHSTPPPRTASSSSAQPASSSAAPRWRPR